MDKIGDWAQLNETIAHKLLSLRGDDEEILGCLAWALEESCIQLPIAEPGEDLVAIDPFTFMASWSRPMPDARRARLLGLVCETLEIEAAIPAEFPGYPEVQDWQARMFSRTGRNIGRELNALWSLLEKGLAYVCASRTDKGSQEAQDAGAALAGAYEQVAQVRCPAKKTIPTLLAWLAPDVFNYIGEAPVKGADYLALLGTQEPSGSLETRRTPSLDLQKTSALVDAFASAYPETTNIPPQAARAASTFLANWDLDASDFETMVQESLANTGDLLFGGYQYNPLREVLVFARTEPEATREAFRLLFDETRQQEERVVPFMRTMCAMFERHRAQIASAMARGSAHESFRTAAAYLFLRYPQTCQPFTPGKLRILNSACGYGCRYRLAKPECITQYDSLCEELRPMLARRPDFERLLASRGLLHVDGLSRRACENILVDELASFACSAPAC